MQPCQLYILVLMAGIAVCGEPGESYHAVPCTIMSILSGRRTENDYCNLKNLLIRQMQTQNLNDAVPYIRTEYEKRALLPLPTCDGAGAVCRSGGRRACVCPSSFVCDPIDSGLHVCVKLNYYTMEK